MAKQMKPQEAPRLSLTPLGEQVPESEQLKEQFYELLVPEEYEELRRYLNNDGFLDNDEIMAALRDGRLHREELAEKLSDLNLPTYDKSAQEKMTNYLWELHEILIDPRVDKLTANQYYRVETIHPLPDSERQLGEDDRSPTKNKDRSLQIVNGGLITNFLHNFKKAYQLDDNPQLNIARKTRYQWQDVEASLAKLGLTQKMLLESGNLDRLLKGEKTGLMEFTSTLDGQETPLRGKLYLVQKGETVIPYFQTVKQSLQIPDQKWGYTFSESDKEALQKKGELGKRVELTFDNDGSTEKTQGYVGVDRETNSLTVWRADRVRIPMQLKGVSLSEDQQETLRQGGAIRVSGMTSENGQKYDADVQLSAGKRSFSFSPLSNAIQESLDQKTAKELTRSPDQLEGTTVGAPTTTVNRPEQKQKRTENQQKGLASNKHSESLEKTPNAANSHPSVGSKKAGKAKKKLNDQSLGV